MVGEDTRGCIPFKAMRFAMTIRLCACPYQRRGRAKAYGLQGLSLYHHVASMVMAAATLNCQELAPDFVWLALCELSSPFALFGLSFFVTRFPVFLYGFCFMLGRITKADVFTIFLAVPGVMATCMLNVKMFCQFLHDAQERFVPGCLRFAIERFVLASCFEPAFVLQMRGEPEPERQAVLAVHDANNFLWTTLWRGDVGLGESFA